MNDDGGGRFIRYYWQVLLFLIVVNKTFDSEPGLPAFPPCFISIILVYQFLSYFPRLY